MSLIVTAIRPGNMHTRQQKSTRTLRRLLTTCILTLLLPLLSFQALADVTASLSRAEISGNETVQLTVSIDESSLFGSDKPNIDILEDDFAILGSSKSRQSSWVNGKKTALSSWVYTLKAKQAGIITIPSINIGKQSSQAIVLKVSPIKTYQSNNATALEAVFIKVELSKSESYVQEGIVLTIKFNDSMRLANIGLSPLQLDSANMIEISNTSYQTNINQRPYTTYEIRYALFPQKSGPLIIPKITVTGDKISQGNGRRARYEPVRIQSEAIQANILAIPNTYIQDHWLPAQSIQLHESYSQDLNNLQLGDALTRTIKLTSKGLSSAQLPELTLPKSLGLKIYPEAAQRNELNNAQDNSTVYSQLSQSFSLVATKAGEITLPEVKIAWFNTRTQSIEFTSLPSKTITVKENQDILAAQNFNSSYASTTNNIGPQQPSDNNVQKVVGNTQNLVAAEMAQGSTIPLNHFSQLAPWLKISFISLLVLVIILFVFVLQLKARIKQIGSTQNESNPKASSQVMTDSQLKETANKGELRILRTQLIQLAQQQWPQAEIFSLSDLSSKLDKASVGILQQLDASLFQSHTAPNTEQLIQLIDALLKSENKSDSASNTLKDLYPR